MGTWWVSHECCMSRWWVLHEYLMSVTWVPDECHKSVTWVSDECHKSVTWVSHEYLISPFNVYHSSSLNPSNEWDCFVGKRLNLRFPMLFILNGRISFSVSSTFNFARMCIPCESNMRFLLSISLYIVTSKKVGFWNKTLQTNYCYLHHINCVCWENVHCMR